MFFFSRSWAAYAFVEKLENRPAFIEPRRRMHRRTQLSHASHAAPGKIQCDDATCNDASFDATRAHRGESHALVANL